MSKTIQGDLIIFKNSSKHNDKDIEITSVGNKNFHFHKPLLLEEVLLTKNWKLKINEDGNLCIQKLINGEFLNKLVLE